MDTGRRKVFGLHALDPVIGRGWGQLQGRNPAGSAPGFQALKGRAVGESGVF